MLHTLDDIVTLDFETFYSAEYSLSLKAYNTSKYVRDPQFKAHCIGIADGQKPAVWYGPDDIAAALKKHAVGARPVCAHNMHFDGFILSQHYDIVSPFYYDTLSMSRALHGHAMSHSLDSVAQLYKLGAKTHGLLKTKGIRDLPPELLEELGDYCANDTELCAKILALQTKNYPDKELRLIDWTVRAFCDPVLYVNQELAKKELEEQLLAKEEKVELAGVSEEVLRSDEKLKDALEAMGVAVPLKFSPATGQLVPAFSKQDKAFKDLLEHDEEVVRRLVEARLACRSTIGISRAERFVEVGSAPLPMGYKYCGAHTTRWSGDNKMNVQNLQRGGNLRRSIEAPPDHVVVVVDSAQIEARLNAWNWDQNDIVKAFAEGQDVYALQASSTYGREITKKNDPDERFVGKVQTLGLGYGMGKNKFQAVLALGLMGQALQITDTQASDWVNAYRRKNNKIVAGWGFLDKVLAQMAFGRSGSHKCFEWEGNRVWLPSGLPLIYDGLRASEHERGVDISYVSNKNGSRSNLWGGTFCENWIQALGRCVVADQALLIMDAGWRVVGTTHDEVISVCHKSQADKCLEDMLKAMRTVPKYVEGAPLDAEGGFDVCYSK